MPAALLTSMLLPTQQQNEDKFEEDFPVAYVPSIVPFGYGMQVTVTKLTYAYKRVT
jgi:hypothetical protein